MAFLRPHKEDFTWTYQDMPSIDPSVIVHKMNVDPKAYLVKQKRHADMRKLMKKWTR